jgi:hypothetical protein
MGVRDMTIYNMYLEVPESWTCVDFERQHSISCVMPSVLNSLVLVTVTELLVNLVLNLAY